MNTVKVFYIRNHSNLHPIEIMNQSANQPKQLPVLYSLRNCPYAMRARMAIFKAKQIVMLRDVVLTNKPEEIFTFKTFIY